MTDSALLKDHKTKSVAPKAPGVKRRGWGKDLLILLGMAAVLFGVLELGVRVYYLSRLGWEGYQKYEFRHDPVFAVVGEKEQNSLGFRGKEFSVACPKDVFRVILVGGSEVFGVYVPLEESLPVILERKLKEAFPASKFEVINAGRLGSVAANEALLMEQLVHLNPNQIIVFDGWNDIYHARYLPKQYEQVMEETTRKFGWSKQLSRWCRRHLWAVRKIREWRDRLRGKYKKAGVSMPEKTVHEQWLEKLQGSEEAMKKEQWISFGWSGGFVHYPVSQLPEPSPMFTQGYYQNLVRIASTARRHGIPVTFVFQPDLAYHKLHRPLNPEEETAFEISTHRFSQDWSHTVEKLYPTGIDTMKRAAQATGVPFYDFSLILLEAKENGFGDTVHLNGFGNTRVAEQMLETLRSSIEARGTK